MCNLPRPGIELVSPALANGFLTTGPPEKSGEQIVEAGVEAGSQEENPHLGILAAQASFTLLLALANRILTQMGNTPGVCNHWNCKVLRSCHQEEDPVLPLLRRRQWHPTPVLLPGKSHGRRSLVGYSPWGLKELDTTERLHFHFLLSCIAEGNGNPLQCSCLENSRDGGAWWAAVYGVAQSWTRLT